MADSKRLNEQVSQMKGWNSIGQVHGTPGIRAFHEEIHQALEAASEQGFANGTKHMKSRIVQLVRARIVIAESALPQNSEKVDAAVRMKLGELKELAAEIESLDVTSEGKNYEG